MIVIQLLYYLKKSNNDNHILCPECKSSSNKKLFSAFSTSQNEMNYSDNSGISGNCSIDDSNKGGCSSGAYGLI